MTKRKIINNTKNPVRFEYPVEVGGVKTWKEITWMIEGDHDTNDKGLITGAANEREVEESVYKELRKQPAFEAMIEHRQLIVLAV